MRATRTPLWLVAPFVAYALYSFARSDLRFEHFAVIAIVVALAVIGPRTRELLRGLYPLGLVFLLYDGMRPYQRVGLSPERVHLCDLRAVESTLFGAGGSTLHDHWQVHHTTALDLACAIPYATFILWCFGGALYLYIKDRPAMHRFMWAFLLLNAAGFVTYHLVPAAPPWYFHEHGCVVDLATKASEGPALARVDAFLGIAYFHGMYAKASSVFGALPSLHCAYPLLLVIEGWRVFGRRGKALTVGYYGAMVFSAVYLDHHWVLDALLGSAYAVLAAVTMRSLFSTARGCGWHPRGRRAMKKTTALAWTLATWFGCGLAPIAPGTVGTLGALPLYFLVRGGGPLAILGTAAIVTAVGIWASNVAVRDCKEKDPQRIVIDEAAGVLLSLAAAPPTWLGVTAAVVLFRLFDITKPFPARRAEHLPAGWGVMLDDLAAALWAVAILLGARLV